MARMRLRDRPRFDPAGRFYVDSVTAVHVPLWWPDAGWNLDGGDDDTEGAQFWEAAECDHCDRVHVSHCGSSIECPGPEPGSVYKDHEPLDLSDRVSGPMMNGYWPLPGERELDAEDAARALVDLPLCVVKVGEVYGLALTGGGMDLSWEIAEAYLRVGYRVPAAIELPGMADRGCSKRDRAIVRQVRESYGILADWCRGRASRLRSLVKDAREREAARRVKP